MKKPDLVEVWCIKCPAAATDTVNNQPYCAKHALEAHWKANSPAWNPERTKNR